MNIYTFDASAKQLSLDAAINRMNEGMTSATVESPSSDYELAMTGCSGENNLFYIVNTSSRGFAIISADDCAPAILAYSNEGTFDVDNIPDDMQWWLSQYKTSIETAIEEHSYLLEAQPVGFAIPPMLNTNWGQGSPYNAQTPTYYGSHCLTGCTATAMAQVMNYAQWPNYITTTIPSYTTNVQLGMLSSLPPTSFNWNSIASGSSSEIAKLMIYCGYALQSNYGTGGTSAYSYQVINAFQNYLGYPGARRIYRENFGVTEWDEIIYNELANNRAVYYDGQSTGGGHAFVIDGYDGNGGFHVNWGWNGLYNGYFKLAILNPHNNSGAGASSTDDGYSMDQGAVIGLCSSNNVLENKIRTESISINGNTITGIFYGVSNISVSMQYGFAILNSNGSLSLIGTYSINNFTPNSGFTKSLNLGNYITTAGTYRIVPVCRSSSSSSWTRTYNTTLYVVATKSSNGTLTLTAHPTQNLTIQNLIIKGDKKLGSQQEFVVTINNNGDDYTGNLYCFISSTSSKGSYVAQTGISIAEGDEEEFSLFLSPTEAGTLTVWFCTDSSGNNVIGTQTITIGSDQTLPANLSISSSSVSTGSGYAKITFFVKNNSSEKYGRSLITEMEDLKTGSTFGNSTINDANISSGYSSGWTATRYGLDDDGVYNFNVYCYKYASGDEKMLVGSVRVEMPNAVTTIPVRSISLSNTSLSVNVGDTKQLTATVLPADATNNSVTWTSSNNNIVDFYLSGGVEVLNDINTKNKTIIAKTSGTATITCTANDGSGVKATCVVTVNTSEPEVISGDVNGDGKVSVSDFTSTANWILGKNPANFNEKAADVNNDNKISVSDLTGIANLILYGTVTHNTISAK